MKGLSYYDRQHIQQILLQQSSVASIFNQFTKNVAPFLTKWQGRSSSNVWIRNQSIENNINKALLELQSSLLSNISSFQIDAWKRSDMKNEDFIKEYIKGLSISSNAKEGMFARNSDALKSFVGDLDARGNNVSSNVWNVAEIAKNQLEFYLKSGLSEGRSAAQIGTDVRQLLDNPDKRFHRIRDKETGKLVLSQPMKDYHPGAGVYRSAKMNALRLTATTTNTAYRSADYDRWSKQDFTLGIKIQRSANNKGPCKICDAMVGEYPKTFKFTGFHPFCICFATPIVMKPEDLANYLVDETIPEDKVIRSIPKDAQSFVSKNKDVLKESYWYKDNFDNDGKPSFVVPAAKVVSKVQEVVSSGFVECKSVEEAQVYAKKIIGVKYADYSDLSVDIANNLNKALETLPKDNLPLFVGSSKKLQQLSDLKFKNKHNGVCVDGIIKVQEDGKWNIDSGVLVGINGKSISAIEKAKLKTEEEYFKRTGHHWRFNIDGESTSYHEIGHVFDYYNNISDDYEWVRIAKKWADESKIDYIQKPSEAFAEAWAAKSLNKKLPPYIEEYMNKLIKKK